jgi:N-acetyl-gamma-glutamylphosphate reductase
VEDVGLRGGGGGIYQGGGRRRSGGGGAGKKSKLESKEHKHCGNPVLITLDTHLDQARCELRPQQGHSHHLSFVSQFVAVCRGCIVATGACRCV